PWFRDVFGPAEGMLEERGRRSARQSRGLLRGNPRAGSVGWLIVPAGGRGRHSCESRGRLDMLCDEPANRGLPNVTPMIRVGWGSAEVGASGPRPQAPSRTYDGGVVTRSSS